MGMACVKVYNLFLYIKGNLLATPSQVRERIDFEEAHPIIGNPDEDQIRANLAQQPPLLFPNPAFHPRYIPTAHLGMVKVPPNYSKDLPNSGYGGKKTSSTPQNTPRGEECIPSDDESNGDDGSADEEDPHESSEDESDVQGEADEKMSFSDSDDSFSSSEHSAGSDRDSVSDSRTGASRSIESFDDSSYQRSHNRR